ncbi:MAG: hypothetical protein E7252_01435 [Lachnospira sp.]|nr:hypothetical protein [Lachnospira sp.]
MNSLVGVIVSDPVVKGNVSAYEVQSANRKYKVISKDYQAVKDNIFINEGQHIEVFGDIIDNTMYAKKSRIILRKAEN